MKIGNAKIINFKKNNKNHSNSYQPFELVQCCVLKACHISSRRKCAISREGNDDNFCPYAYMQIKLGLVLLLCKCFGFRLRLVSKK